jgi:digeranylgeranylglycerophospholipid reductase
MSDQIEIAVVGAGPAGSTAAEVAARMDREVMLIERKSEIGSPVQCGGFLPEQHELKALMPRAKLPPTLTAIPERCVLHRTTMQRLYSPSGGCREFSVDGRVIDRRAFDRHLAYRAAHAGVRIYPATRAEPKASSIELSGYLKGAFTAEVIIAADGPHSSFSRQMGNAVGERGTCLEYEMVDVDIDPTAAEMYFGTRYAPGGYAWIIPLGPDSANVGIGVRASYLGSAKLPQILDGFIRNHPIAGEKLKRGEVLAVMRGTVPAGGMPKSIRRENVLLAGDSAGQVMATSGGGIPLAMVAGKIAGETAARFLQGSGTLEEYEQAIRREFGEELARSVQIRKLVDAAMKSDRLMDAVFATLEPEHIKMVMRAQLPDPLRRIRDLVPVSRQR